MKLVTCIVIAALSIVVPSCHPPAPAVGDAWSDWSEQATSENWCDLSILVDAYKPVVDVDHWIPCVGLFDWPIDEALAIMACESGGRSRAVNMTDPGDVAHGGSRGLMQIGQLHVNDSIGYDVYNPRVNLSYAHMLYIRNDGWRDWRNCAHKLGLL